MGPDAGWGKTMTDSEFFWRCFWMGWDIAAEEEKRKRFLPPKRSILARFIVIKRRFGFR